MPRRWIHETDTGQRLEYRLPPWLPLWLRLLGLVGVLRGRTPGEADVERLMQRHAWVRVLPHGVWERWRDLPGRTGSPPGR
jgi:hypothetical protein